MIFHALAALLLLWLIGTAQAPLAGLTGEVARIRQAGPEPPKQTTKPRRSPKRPEVSEEALEEAGGLLISLGYWVDLGAEGLDVSLRHALIAFQKVEGRPRTGVLTEAELEALRHGCRPQAREPGAAHLEIDLDRQVLFVVDDEGLVSRILPVSTGSGEFFTEGGRTRRAVTPLGRFTVAYKIEGWRKSPLGLLYYPSYLYDGIAIHGNPSVPTRPASHGCIRIPMFAAKEFYEIAAPGMIVLIYDSNRPGQTVPLAAMR
ncbi:MAG TPA: L,D-transpeptidase [Blastocatellia bacterium]|nr:L,D-transpeptidase [Blastocatellia bacterium]